MESFLSSNLVDLVVMGVSFIIAVILHEIAHGYVANLFGDDTAKVSGRLSLNPIVHIDPVGSIFVPLMLIISQVGIVFGWAKPVPVNPYRLKGGQSAYRWVSLAGIFTNLALAVVSAIILKIALQAAGIGPNNLGVMFFGTFMVVNLVLAVFNSLPFPGFDGFNFLTTFNVFSQWIAKTPFGNPMFMARYGLFVSVVLIVLFMPVVGVILNFFLRLFASVFGI